MADFAQMIARHDRAFYLSSLLLPDAKRQDVQALWAFMAELASIPPRISEPMMGEIRLQWWLDVLKGERASEAQNSPLASAVCRLKDDYQLPLSGFEAMVESTIFELYHDPIETWQDLEVYLGGKFSAPLQMASLILGQGQNTSDVAGHGGVAYGLMRGLQDFQHLRQQGKTLVPESLLQEHGVNRANFLADIKNDKADVFSKAYINKLDTYLQKTSASIASLEKQLRPAFLPLATLKPLLKKARKANPNAFCQPPSITPLKQQFAIWRMARSGKL